MDKATLSLICSVLGFLCLGAGPIGIIGSIALFMCSYFLWDQYQEEQRNPNQKDGNKDVDLFN